MVRLHLFCVVIGLITPHVVSKYVQFYRKDYTYIEEYDAYYKLHWDSSSWNEAFKACNEEGSKLLYPKGDEWKIVKNLTETMSIGLGTTEMFVGLHDEFNLGEFVTIDGKPTENPLNAAGEEDGFPLTERCLLMDYLTGQFRIAACTEENVMMKPFVCKKVDNESCPTIDNEYIYVKSLKKCYKVNSVKKTWQAAMHTCFMEGGLLAVIESQNDVTSQLNANQAYFVGFKKMFDSSNFYTVKGNTLQNTYFDGPYYAYNYPDNRCGVVTGNKDIANLLSVTNCNDKLPFICEMEI